MLDIREASLDDLPAILAIYNDVLATSTAIYRDEPATLDDRRSWMAARQAEGHPVLVAIDGGDVVGFAGFGGFRPWPGTASPSSTACTSAPIDAARAWAAP